MLDSSVDNRGGQPRQPGCAPLPPFRELRAGLVMVSGTSSSRLPLGGVLVRRGRAWLLPLLRLMALAIAGYMICLSPTKGMGMGVEVREAWSAGTRTGDNSWAPGTASDPSRSPERTVPKDHEQRQRYVLFVGVADEGAVEPLKAMAQEMILRGYRVRLALPAGLHRWVEDIPNLGFLPMTPVDYVPRGVPVWGRGQQGESATGTNPHHVHCQTPQESVGGSECSTDEEPEEVSCSFGSSVHSQGEPKRSTVTAGSSLGGAWGGGIGGG
ncbi:unnamed protein product, partial [Choristocarpus tenellus]